MRMRPFRSACSHRFSPYSIERGEELVSSSKLALVKTGPTMFVARVAEESASIVSSETTPEMLAMCTCPMFSLGLDGCRHLWALVAKLEDANVMQPSMLRRGFDLVPLHPPSAESWTPARRLDDLEGSLRHRRRRGRGGRWSG